MADPEVHVHGRESDGYTPAGAEPPTFRDAVRFVYDRRVRIAGHFVIFCVIGLLGFVAWLLLRPQQAEGRVLLTFRGIENGEYPSGKKFSTEDFRAPDVVEGALADAGIPKQGLDLSKLSARINVIPIIPPDVISRWKKQDREGMKREEYVPREFEITIGMRAIPADTQIRLFDAVVKRYRDHVKFEEKSALRFVSDWSANSYRDLLRDYDYWEIPYVLGQNVEIMNNSLKKLVEESKDYRDPSSELTFRDLQKDLSVWSVARLEALRALTYKGRLVKNKAAALLTAQYRLEDLTIQLRAKTEQTAESMKLAEVLQRPQPPLATQATGMGGVPILDSSVMDRVVRSDYLSPLVRRISALQDETKDLEEKKWRLEKDVTYLPEAHDTPADQLPKDYQDLVGQLTKELSKIVDNYNRLLDRYLTATVTSLVAVKEGPRITRGFPIAALLAIILVLAAILALFSVVLEHVITSSLRRATP